MFATALENFHQELNTRVFEVPEPLKKAALGIEVASKTLVGLKELVEHEDFDDVPQEIHFLSISNPAR